jgi:hypothetical protein
MTTIQIIFGSRAQENPRILANSSLQQKPYLLRFTVGWLVFTVLICHNHWN